jgi:SAM-dependent methyltransferase
MEKFSLGMLASKYAPLPYKFYVENEEKRQFKRVERLLSETGGSAGLADDCFDQLMVRGFPRSAAYDYDPFSATVRASIRIQRLAKLFPMLKSPRKVFEVSCGDGLVGSLVSHGGHRVTLADIRDWRSEPAMRNEFITWDVCGDLMLKPDQFDIVLAYNATEHWSDPGKALANLLSLCKPGGYVLLDFGPLFNSPWGLHAWSIGFPYPQFLFSRQLIDAKIRTIGVSDLGNSENAVQPTNGWSLANFRTLWRESRARIISNLEDRDHRYLDFVEEFAGCFKGRGLHIDEITVNSIEIVLQKP